MLDYFNKKTHLKLPLFIAYHMFHACLAYCIIHISKYSAGVWFSWHQMKASQQYLDNLLQLCDVGVCPSFLRGKIFNEYDHTVSGPGDCRLWISPVFTYKLGILSFNHTQLLVSCHQAGRGWKTGKLGILTAINWLGIGFIIIVINILMQ